MDKIKILNIDILATTQQELLHRLNKGILITPNVDHLIKLQKDKLFYDAYQQAEWVICDSKIIYFFSKLLKQSLPESIPGSSFFTAFYEYHKNDPECRIFLLGAAEGVAKKAMERINQKIGRNIIVDAYSPSYGFEKKTEECKELVRIINQSKANVLVVGTGAPKQEKWIIKYHKDMPKVNIFMGLGATIDFEAGNLKRASTFWREIGMEWFYRFMKEPRRLFKRYFIDDIQIFYYFMQQLLGAYKNPFNKSV